MKIDVIEKFSVSSYLDDSSNQVGNSSASSLPKHRISSWILVDMHLRGRTGVVFDDGTSSLNLQSVLPIPNLLLVGTESGRLLYFSLPVASGLDNIPNFRSIRPVEVSVPQSTSHFAQITSLMVLWLQNSPTSSGTAPSNLGLRRPQDSLFVFTGSLDRTIKVWNFSDIANSTSGISSVGGGSRSGTQTSILAQTLCGHNGGITQIVDGSRDGLGGILSSSMDGTIRVWIAQK